MERILWSFHTTTIGYTATQIMREMWDLNHSTAHNFSVIVAEILEFYAIVLENYLLCFKLSYFLYSLFFRFNNHTLI